MKTETWDDVVFENRNKMYGAYVVRQSYQRNTTIALGASVAFVVILLFVPRIVSSLTGGKVVIPVLTKTCQMEFTNPPILLPEKPVEVRPVIKTDVPRNLPPELTIAEVTDPLPTNAELINNQPTIGDDITFIEPTDGTTVIEEPEVTIPSGPVDLAEVMPVYSDGGYEAMMRFIARNTRYPRSAIVTGTEGTVFVGFVVSADGEVINVKVVRGLTEDCDKEAVRVISKMGAWKPGMMHGRSVAVRMVIPLKFQLSR